MFRDHGALHGSAQVQGAAAVPGVLQADWQGGAVKKNVIGCFAAVAPPFCKINR